MFQFVLNMLIHQGVDWASQSGWKDEAGTAAVESQLPALRSTFPGAP